MGAVDKAVQHIKTIKLLLKTMSKSNIFVASLFIFLPKEIKAQLNFQGHFLTEHEYKTSLSLEGFLFFEIISPKELQYTYKISPSRFSPKFNVSNTRSPTNLVIAHPPCACGYITNKDDVEGNVVLVERGECSFVSKTLRAQEAGAAGIIITDADQENDELYISMLDDETQRKVSIPAAFLLGKNGHYIRNVLRRQNLDRAVIRIPLNISTVPLVDINQPPWLVW